MEKTIEQLAESLDMNISEYYNYFVNTYINGQYGQLREMLENITIAGKRWELVENIKKNELLEYREELLSWISSN